MKIRMRHSYLVVFFLFIAPLICAAGQTEKKDQTVAMSFEEAIAVLREHNYSIRATEKEHESVKYETKAIKGLYMPKLSVTGTYTVLSDDIEMHVDLTDAKKVGAKMLNGMKDYMGAVVGQLPPSMQAAIGGAMSKVPAPSFKGLPNSLSLKIQDQQLGLITGNLVQPIYMGGKINAANRAAKAKYKVSDLELINVTNQQITELAARYYGLQLATKLVKVRREVVDGFKKHLEDSKHLEKQGMISKAERLHANVAYMDAVQKHKAAVKDMELVQIGLQNTLGIGYWVEPTTELGIMGSLNDVAYYQEYAQKNNPKLLQVDQKQIMVEQLVKKERSEYLPEIALIGSGNIYEYQVTDLVPNWFVGIGVKINIFDGFARENKIKAAKAKRSQVAVYKDKASHDINTVVLKTYHEIEKASESATTLDSTMEFAEEYYRVRNKAFKEGFATSTQVVDAQMNLSKTKIERLQSMYQYDMAFAKLLEWCGMSESFVSYTVNKK
ncbi:TolC family protein [Halosquirtibacter xylanolyticus]|uniref:TolC family protein n=1 Tax=Halosquirtibacter xylanolyticus TaxID=3374599 RepID=UPI003749F010|nr:TolC family protein [Prolixibacteraceae bacterium]